MQELIKIEMRKINGDEVNSVDVRKLYHVLGVKKDFSSWFRSNVQRLSLVNGVHYIQLTHNGERDNIGLSRIDYAIQFDFAKHIAMLTLTPKAHKVRDYFIEVENQWREGQNELLNNEEYLICKALQLSDKKVKMLEAENRQLKSKASVFDRCISSKDLLSMEEVAKILHYKGHGRNNLFGFLRDWKVLRENNIPYQQFIDRGYFICRNIPYTRGEGESAEECIYVKTMATQRGLAYIQRLLAGVEEEA